METKAEKFAQWVIGITIAYPVLIFLICFFNDPIRNNIMDSITVFCFYLIMPIVVVNWILSVWSLKIKKSTIGFCALICTIIYSLIFGGALYIFTTVKMC